ncbi:MAG: hypothetical protein JJU46_03085 [Balneolaceae bacterium]|nr:hypothetical protein [Balneolaceae bacterium]MCH8547829.1 NapC/NirT family cytochrome c [Balneolaceae bacterium]
MKKEPTKRPDWILQASIALLVLFGITSALIGVYVVDGDIQPNEPSLEEIHAGVNMEPEETRTTVYGNVIPLYATAQSDPAPRVASEADSGVTVGELMRRAGIFSIVAAILILIYIEFFRRDNISRLSYRSLMIVSMFALPVVVVLSTGTTVLETTKTVESCASCHVMDPFVNDLFDEESTTMAAKHYQNRWISEYHCYTTLPMVHTVPLKGSGTVSGTGCSM